MSEDTMCEWDCDFEDGNVKAGYIWFDAEIDGSQALIGNYYYSGVRDPMAAFQAMKTNQDLWDILNQSCCDRSLVTTSADYVVMRDDSGAWVLRDKKKTPFSIENVKRIFIIEMDGDGIAECSYNLETHEINADCDMNEHPQSKIQKNSVDYLIEYYYA